MRHPVFPKPWQAVVAGAAALYVAAWCFEDAWEGRDRKRPALARWLAV